MRNKDRLRRFLSPRSIPRRYRSLSCRTREMVPVSPRPSGCSCGAASPVPRGCVLPRAPGAQDSHPASRERAFPVVWMAAALCKTSTNRPACKGAPLPPVRKGATANIQLQLPRGSCAALSQIKTISFVEESQRSRTPRPLSPHGKMEAVAELQRLQNHRGRGERAEVDTAGWKKRSRETKTSVT